MKDEWTDQRDYTSRYGNCQERCLAFHGNSHRTVNGFPAKIGFLQCWLTKEGRTTSGLAISTNDTGDTVVEPPHPRGFTLGLLLGLREFSLGVVSKSAIPKSKGLSSLSLAKWPWSHQTWQSAAPSHPSQQLATHGPATFKSPRTMVHHPNFWRCLALSEHRLYIYISTIIYPQILWWSSWFLIVPHNFSSFSFIFPMEMSTVEFQNWIMALYIGLFTVESPTSLGVKTMVPSGNLT